MIRKENNALTKNVSLSY